MPKNKPSDFIEKLFYIQNQIQLKHWEETSGWRHKQLGKFYQEIGNLIDELVESTAGIYKDEVLVISNSMYTINNNIEISELLSDILIIFFDLKKHFIETNPDLNAGLINIIDNTISVINRTANMLDKT